MTKTQQSKIDLEFRPETYFPESLNRQQLLAKIQGQARREIVESQLEEEGFQSLDTFIARPELTEDQRQSWSRLHPWMMGGEFLPEYETGEVEIARVSLQSVTFDQKSVRARPDSNQIRLSVEDEYETKYVLPFDTIPEPLSLGQLIEFIDAVVHPDDVYTGGLVISHWNYLEDELRCHPSESVDFASIESAIYPDLKRYYDQCGKAWIKERLVPYMIHTHGISEERWPAFIEGLNSEWTLEALSMLPILEFSILEENPNLTSKEVERIRQTEYRNYA